MKTTSAVLILCAIFGVSHGAKILLVFSVQSYSHHIVGKVLAEELAQRGHEVTMISSIKIEEKPNLKHVHLDITMEEMMEILGNAPMSPNDMADVSAPSMYLLVSNMGLKVTEITLSNKNFQKHLKENHKYDMVILEHFFMESLKVLCNHYQAHCISVSTVGSNPALNYLVGNPASPSFIPDFFLAYGGEMNLLQRGYNLIYQTFAAVVRELYFLPQHEALAKKYFPNVHDIFGKTSLIFLNSHFSLTQPVPHVPNMVEIGGIHIKLKNKIPEDIKKFLDEATDGVIYFSLGSNLRSADISLETREGLLKTFAQLKQRVLWKFEDKKFDNLPKNVKISKWLPQPDILAHPNVKIFITHGGLLSLTEATRFGVPVIGIPFYGDQPMNMAEVERIGIGIKIERNDFNGNTVKNAINEMLTNKRYSETMKKRSAIFNDRPLSPMDTAIYWVEYLLRHNGGLHMQSTAMKLNWYQYYLIDVILLIVLVTFVPIYFMHFLLQRLCRKFCTKKDKLKSMKKMKTK